MKASLIIPRPAIADHGQVIADSKHTIAIPLTRNTERPESHYGIGVLEFPGGEILDGFMFRHLRDTTGAWVKTDDEQAVASCLGVPWQGDYREAGIGQPHLPAHPKPRDINCGHVKQ